MLKDQGRQSQENDVMDKVQKRCLQALQPGAGFIRDEIALAPLPHRRTSLDLLRGSGGPFSGLGEKGLHPSAAQILGAQGKHGWAILKIGQYYIMWCHWRRRSQHTVLTIEQAQQSLREALERLRGRKQL